MAEELPSGWVRTTLGEICALNPGMRFDETPPDHTEVSFVPMAAVEEESGRLDPSEIRPLWSVGRGYTPFKEDDVIFAKITPCMENGKIALATGLKNGLAYGSTEFFVFRSYEGMLPRFVLHYLLQPSLRKAAERAMSGAVGQKRVPANYLFTHEFLLPPTAEQDRIVAKLDASLSGLERAEAVAQRARERVKAYRAAVLRAAVTGALTRDWRVAQRRNKQSSRENGKALLHRLLGARRARWEEGELQRLKASGEVPKDNSWKSRYSNPLPPKTNDLPTLPKNWAWASLEMVADIRTGVAVSRNRFLNNPVELPYLRVANVLRGEIDLRTVKTIRIEKEQVPQYLLKKGDILFNEGGDRDKLGRGWVWEGQLPECVHQNHVFRARLINGDLLNGRFVSHWGNTFGQALFIQHAYPDSQLGVH